MNKIKGQKKQNASDLKSKVDKSFGFSLFSFYQETYI
jgi:hypothetical protein